MNPHAEFLTQFFNELNSRNIVYCVTKNYENLPEESTRDVDIWIKKEHFKKAREILLNVAKSLGWEFIKSAYRLNYYRSGEHYFIKKDGNLYNCLTIEIFPILHWKGIKYMDEKVISKHIVPHSKGFYIPSPGIEAAALIFRGGMVGQIKEEHKPKILKCLSEDKETFIKVLKRPFGKKIALKLYNLLLAGNFDYIEKNIHRLHLVILRRAITYRLFSQLKDWLIYYSGRIKEHFFPSDGFFIVFIGPDGSGKTTIAKSLMESEFIRRLFCMKEYIYRRFHIKWFKKITGTIKSKGIGQFDAQITPQGDIIPLNKFKSVLYVLYLGFEFFLGHYYIRRKRANSGLIIFDRYFYDYMTFKDFINCPRWLMFFLAKLIPKPDAIIYLKNEPEVIYSRKPERSIEEIRRQAQICEEIVKRLPNTYVVENSAGIEGTINKIQDIIIRKLRHCRE